MIKLLSYLWQLPQHLLGLLLLLVFGCEDVMYYKGARVYTCTWIEGGVSLGKYIFLDVLSAANICHEYGHYRQSRILGPFYLLAVGLWSGIRCWLHLYRKGEYYKGYPENWADRLGHVYTDSEGRRNAIL